MRGRVSILEKCPKRLTMRIYSGPLDSFSIAAFRLHPTCLRFPGHLLALSVAAMSLAH